MPTLCSTARLPPLNIVNSNQARMPPPPPLWIHFFLFFFMVPHPLWIWRLWFLASQIWFHDVRWIPLLCVWKTDPTHLRKEKKGISIYKERQKLSSFLITNANCRHWLQAQQKMSQLRNPRPLSSYTQCKPNHGLLMHIHVAAEIC